MNPAAPCTDTIYDVAVIGGGINGTGIARDAAGRGLSVFLCEKGDLAQGTSSASSKMIHGGLRYLEFYEFRLVREALREREVLLKAAPHIIWPIEFVLPRVSGLRPAWMLRAGLFLYDHLAPRRRLPASYAIDLRVSRLGRPLKKFMRDAFVYADCWVEDSRLVILTAMDAAQRGAVIAPRTGFARAWRDGDAWRVTVQPQNGAAYTVSARHLVNAGGPGLARIAQRIETAPEHPVALRLIKGSHIIVPRLYEGEHAYLLQHPDKRMVFALPYEDEFTLIGTTESQVDEAELDHPRITDAEIDYLLDAVNAYFIRQVSRADVRHHYSGIRPLFDDGEASARRVTRDYRLMLDGKCLSIYGGKITTFRRLAEEAVNKILHDRGESATGKRAPWTAGAVLPGGDIGTSLTAFTQSVLERYAFLDEATGVRLASQYGARVHELLDGVSSLHDMGQHFGGGLYASEVDYLARTEWAADADDILQRRTKLGLHDTASARDKVQAYLDMLRQKDNRT